MCVCEDSWTGPKCEDTPITTVHVVQSCHLDVGFANTAPGIVNLWFDHQLRDPVRILTPHGPFPSPLTAPLHLAPRSFPYAISVAQELKAANSTARLKFMVQSYLVSL